jgi:hypothetical protein
MERHAVRALIAPGSCNDVHEMFLTTILPYAFLPPIPAWARATVMTRREAEAGSGVRQRRRGGAPGGALPRLSARFAPGRELRGARLGRDSQSRPSWRAATARGGTRTPKIAPRGVSQTSQALPGAPFPIGEDGKSGRDDGQTRSPTKKPGGAALASRA